VWYEKGVVVVLKEGRYGVNSNTFEVGRYINTQQQNVRFREHPVLLDGGISMLVEGLLTYQIVDVVKLIREIGEADVLHSIENTTKAELCRIFASVHLEQLVTPGSGATASTGSAARGLLGDQKHVSIGEGGSGGKRTEICHEVVECISPIATLWGVKVINFQLESTKIADQKYARESEECSLGLAKAQANRRAVAAKNDILIQEAKARAEAQRIAAEGTAAALIIDAKGRAQARTIEAKARNDAAQAMTDEFGKALQLNQLQVDFASNLKAQVLTVGQDSVVGRMASVPYLTSAMSAAKSQN
jgi:regulator of protease activity HflC (stomatin/prohibitin superfamily)